MTRGQMIFFVLILCSAIVSGTTLGIVSNFDLIVQQVELNAAQTAAEADAKESAVALDELQPDTADAPLILADTATASGSSQLMLITPQEQDELRIMLRQLGMTEKQHTADFIRDFQRSNSLDATGHLDSQTLNLMIKQATYNRVASSAQN